ncbi:glycosyltransferase [Bacteroidia bacterium]|nr:glycosyltransferase [Bacteroidia bacterium]MDC1395076.1 glycosyltransferase [Bacteroidia bacterium]
MLKIKSDNLSITIITPNLNGGRFLEECILSILRQNYTHLQHVIIDGGSTDDSLEIIAKYNVKYEVVPKLNNYEAIHYGFGKYPSDIQAWLNADDVYRDGALMSVMKVFAKYDEISWLTGIPSLTDGSGRIKPTSALPCPMFSKYFYLFRRNNYIQQESTFWRSSLYAKANGLSKEYKYANDYALWFNFFKYEILFTLPQILASFRQHGGAQISVKNKDLYIKEVLEIIGANELNQSLGKRTLIKTMLYLDYLLLNIPMIRLSYMNSLFRQKYLAFAPLIEFQHGEAILKKFI